VAIEVRHATIRIRGDDTVTDATQRDAKPFLLRRDFTREALLLRDVADGLRHGDDRAVRLAHWRDGYRDVNAMAVLRHPNGLEVLDALAAADPGQDRILFRLPFGRYQHAYRSSNQF